MLKQIFIVEDHPLMRKMTREFVELMPEVEVCGAVQTAEEALDQLAQAAPDLILIDVSLPGMSGIDLVAALQARRAPEAPAPVCLMLSGHTEATYVSRAHAAGAQGYVMKGDPTALVESIREILGRREDSGARV